MASDASEQPKSQPLQVFEDHLEHLKRLLDVRRSFAMASINGIEDDLRALASTMRQPTMEQRDALDSSLAATQKKLDDVQEAMTTTFGFLDAWQLVMVVSFTEAYLEDALILLVQENPKWMKESTQNVSYTELLRATSIPDLLTQMQRRWAKNIINGTQAQWIERLKKFGATGYRAELGKEMRPTWEKRNRVVHSPSSIAQVATADFQGALDVIKAFLDPTEAFLLKFLAS